MPQVFALVAAAVGLLSAPLASASSVYIASLCRGGLCTDPKFPILDFDQEKGECLCRAHPCWDNRGISHACPDDSGMPFLRFTHSQDGDLQCSCSRLAIYDSLHISRVLCPGHACNSADFPILDWGPVEGKCFCRASPCPSQADLASQCTDPDTPILHYREEKDVAGPVKPKCDCVAKLDRPFSGLRGKRSVQSSASCTWNGKQI
mmetsp:Transcript_97152/g.247065  ORF Transcript_97152/g.247065 Transcript_97152/m.247065 type:complete len:205 (+) Transcript_97152:52-666(+)